MKHGRFGAMLSALAAIAAMNVGAIAAPVRRAAQAKPLSAKDLDYATPSRTIGSGYGRRSVAQDRRLAKKRRNQIRNRKAHKGRG